MTKEAIANAATSLFNQYGIRSVTMDELAASLGGSKKTIYRYYKDKQHLVEDIYLSLLERVQEDCISQTKKAGNAIREILGGWLSIKQLVHLYHQSVFRDIQRYYPAIHDRYKHFKQEFLINFICSNIERGQKEGIYRENLLAGIIAIHQVENIEVYYQTTSQSTQWSANDIDQQLLSLYLNGLVNAAHAENIEQCIQELTVQNITTTQS